LSGATFGRKGGGIAPLVTPAADPALAARRAAFLAEERARRDNPQARDEIGGTSRTPIFVREKSTGTAYLLWFFLCGLSAHRFYLGYFTSAVIQLAMMPIGYAMVFAGSFAGVFPIFCGGLWMLGDAFVIPSMVRNANSRIRDRSVGAVFA
jgi:TM2 domain-containing membrane protein YozV